MNRALARILVCVGAAALWAPAPTQAADRKPNILVHLGR
jgi:hypothetical protein